MTEDEMMNLALEDVHTAVDLVRGNTSDDPIVWLTGNSHMPPLRAFGNAEKVWDADEDGSLWEAYAEFWENAVENHNIYVGFPEYDNALFAVDLQKWEYVEDNDGETLQSEWQRRQPE